MARVWFVRRRGGDWIAPGGRPAFELPFAQIVFPLDLGTHRGYTGAPPVPAPELPAEPPEELQRVIVELAAEDVGQREFSGYAPGYYDSGLSPRAAAQRLAASPGARA